MRLRTLLSCFALALAVLDASAGAGIHYVITDLGMPAGATASYAMAVNSGGMIAGYAVDPSSPAGDFAAVYSGGSWTDIGTPFISVEPSFATGINDSGQVVAWCRAGGQFSRLGDSFLWQSGVGYTNLGTQAGVLNGQPGNGQENRVGGLNGDTVSFSIAGGGINNSGQVTGFSG